MNYDQLKQLLALMLTETVEWEAHCGPEPELHWTKEARDGQSEIAVLDTELLHLCSLVEAGLTDSEYIAFAHALNEAWLSDEKPPTSRIALCRSASATWQQRTTKLAEVLGVAL